MLGLYHLAELIAGELHLEAGCEMEFNGRYALVIYPVRCNHEPVV